MKHPGKEALQRKREALRNQEAGLAAAREGDRLSAICHRDTTIALFDEAASLQQIPHAPEIGAGGEVLPTTADGYSEDSVLAHETLLHPDAVNIGASADRLELLETTDTSVLGIDAAESIQAKDSLEKMLAHQLAVAHRCAMRLVERADDENNPAEVARMMNSSTRMMKAFQAGLLALHKIRSGGKQVVVVQHLQVSDGGQAIVAGTVNGKKGTPDGG